MKFLQLNGYHFSVSVEEAVNMCVTIAVESLTDESSTTYAKWVSEHSFRINGKKIDKETILEICHAETDIVSFCSKLKLYSSKIKFKPRQRRLTVLKYSLRLAS